ncbi:putative porin [Hydrogenophaga crocea]|uniref:Outer membrane receptor for ferric coprogen and ferric-rhodotorulic acid n=1 Tax=Hydrogenophaga crocea TaxID=2716225 RepID=A0A6G8IC69_9BURK|nr:putative porin [Hydrogenophaga crocea]QIM50729.1 outer membrane receptor for ferric coprogen and ferric-rhodotorulic acid [Hydrogenophaga crocea]
MNQQPFAFALRPGVLAAALLIAGAAQAQTAGSERESLETLRQTTLQLIEALVQQGVLPADKARALVAQAEARARATVAEQQKAEQNTVRIQYVPASVRQQIANEVREEVVAQAKAERWGDVNAVPEWVDRFRFDGEIRVGYQRDMFDKTNAPEVFQQIAGQNINNTLIDRDRERLRARLGLTARVTQDVTAALRLTTGSSSDPVSTNQTLGNYGSKYNFALDRAYLRARSQDVLPWLTTTAGRIPNPFFSTDLMWDDDLAFDGIALQYEDPAASTREWRPFATVGWFPLQDSERSASNAARSRSLLAAQGGVEWVPSNEFRAKVGLALYDFRNVSGVRNDFNSVTQNGTQPAFRQKGNTLFNLSNPTNFSGPFGLAADYRVLNLTTAVDYTLFNPVHLILGADYVKNIGYSQARTLARTGLNLAPEDQGYMLRAAIGMPNMLLKGDWQLSLAYRYLEADAVLDAFTDSDFHLGGTNNKGFIVGAQYGLSRNTWLSARWLSSREISGLPLSINSLQVNFHARF